MLLGSSRISSRPMILMEAVTFLLALEFLLGMYLNLFWANGSLIINLVLAAHITVAFAMVAATAIALYLLIRSNTGKKECILVGLTLASLILSGSMGYIFLNYGHNSVVSYLMAFFFLAAYGFVGYTGAALRKPGKSKAR